MKQHPSTMPIERNQSVPEVEPSWVARQSEGFRIVDVRESVEFNGPLGHIDGSELVPLGTLASVAGGWPRDEKLVLVCRSGARSGRAALLLESMEFERVASMRGGMMLWREVHSRGSIPS